MSYPGEREGRVITPPKPAQVRVVVTTSYMLGPWPDESTKLLKFTTEPVDRRDGEALARIFGETFEPWRVGGRIDIEECR